MTERDDNKPAVTTEEPEQTSRRKALVGLAGIGAAAAVTSLTSTAEASTWQVADAVLIKSTSTNPSISVPSGYKVITMTVKLPDLTPAEIIGATLCGGSGTCMAVVKVDVGCP